MSLIPQITFPPKVEEENVEEEIIDEVANEEAPAPAPAPEPKVKVNDEDVFQGKKKKVTFHPKTPEKSEESEDIILPQEDNPNLPNGRNIVEPTTKAPKKKRVMSEKQKEHLKKAREKALATRRKNKALKDEAAAIKRQEKEEVARLKKEKLEARKMEIQQQKDIIERKEQEQLEQQMRELQDIRAQQQQQATGHLQQNIHSQISKSDLEEIMFRGIQRYDTLRKEQKQKKRQLQQEQQRERQILNTITRNKPQFNSPYSNCFNFT